MRIYCVSKRTVFNCIWQVVDALNGHLSNIHFPIDDPQDLKKLEAGFRAASIAGRLLGGPGGCH